LSNEGACQSATTNVWNGLFVVLHYKDTIVSSGKQNEEKKLKQNKTLLRNLTEERFESKFLELAR